MKKMIYGYALWVFLAGCLYFFENNTGTRVLWLCSVLFLLVPALRLAYFSIPQAGRAKRTARVPRKNTKHIWRRRKTDIRENQEMDLGEPVMEPDLAAEDYAAGDIRGYLPGDPLNRIHWKLSAKRGELLIREPEEDSISEMISKRTERQRENAGIRQEKLRQKRAIWLGTGLLFLLLLLLWVIPEARYGFQALCNRLFKASEARNRYVYEHFAVSSCQRTGLAGGLLAGILVCLTGLVAVWDSRPLAMGAMACCIGGQVYLGVPLPGWMNGLLFLASAGWMMRQALTKKNAALLLAMVLAVTGMVTLFWPGVDSRTEAASEKVRDWLSQAAEQITSTVYAASERETEVRHVHTQSLMTGDGMALPEREYRLLTVEEEKISMPHWVNYLRICLLLLAVIALVTLPFLPFMVLNARRRRAMKVRRQFQSENGREAVCSIFRHVIALLEAAQSGAGNLPYRDWAEALPDFLPADYRRRFRECAALFEEAAYSEHEISRETREQVMRLLEETRLRVMDHADWKQRMYIRGWKCLTV